MRRFQRSLVGVSIAFAFFAAMAGSFLAGKTYGVWEYIYLSTPGQGWWTVTLLRTLREGQTDKAIEMLEVQLNMEIIQHWNYRPKIVEAVLGSTGRNLLSTTPRMMAILVEYRDQYPWSEPEWVTKNPTMHEWAVYDSSQVHAALDFYRPKR